MFQFLRRPVARDVAAAWLTAGLMLQTATGAAPDWWAVRGVYKAGAAADDYAVANVGQLKHIASRAAAEMNATLAGGAGDMVNNLVASWLESASPRDDYSALTAGQLKQVARMFYDRLAGGGAAAVYPWGSPLPADDHAIVNTGQVKRVFSFPVDSNGNTLPDLWEMLMFGHLGEALNTDFDGDGLSNLQEWSFGTSAKNQDSDDDGYFDGDEHAMGAYPKKADSVPQPNLVFYHRTAASAAWKTGFAPFTGSSSMSYTTKTTEMNLSKTVNDHGTTTSPPTSWTYLYDGSSSYTLTEAWERGVGTVLTLDTFSGAFNDDGSYNFGSESESDEEYISTGPSGEAHTKWHREETIEPGDFDARSTGHWSIKQFGSAAETGSWDERTSPGSGGGAGGGPPFPTPVVTTNETVITTTWALDAPYGFNGHASGGGTQVETLSGVIPDSAMVSALAGDFGLAEAWPPTFDGSGDGTSQFTLLSGYTASGTATQYYYKLEWPEGTPERVKQTGNYARSYLIQENYRSDDLSVEKKAYKHITLKPGESCEPMLLSAITFDSTRSGLAWVGPDDHHAVEITMYSEKAALDPPRSTTTRPDFSVIGKTNWGNIYEDYQVPQLVIDFKDVLQDPSSSTSEILSFKTHLTFSPILPQVIRPVWAKVKGPESGTLSLEGSTVTSHAKYIDPKKGGVYEFDVDFQGQKTRTYLVLPLAGAEVKDMVAADLVLADAFAVKVMAKYNPIQINNPIVNSAWFWTHGAGDYWGRPDNAQARTVWKHNQVSNITNMGVVATWFGTPVRVTKISNFMFGYAGKKMGMDYTLASTAAQQLGTSNDGAATKSFEAGWTVGGGADYASTTEPMVKDIWDEADDGGKTRRLWPNMQPLDNQTTRAAHFDMDRNFSHPGFLEMTP